MQHWNYRAILYFISLVILITLGIQVYWNYKNYQSEKQQLINEVQSSLDNAVDMYYIDLTSKNTKRIFKRSDSISRTGLPYRFLRKENDTGLASGSRVIIRPDSLRQADSRVRIRLKEDKLWSEANSLRNIDDQDSLETVFNLTSRVMISIITDTLNTSHLNSFIDDHLRQKNLGMDYAYVFKSRAGHHQEFNQNLIEGDLLTTQSKSAYLPRESVLNFYFTNQVTTILQRNLLGIFLSAVLIFTVIACLLFLLRIIKSQKQLTEVWKDLVSNITHEFKTPISTIKVALEGIENYNEENDPAKTKRFLQASHHQLDKLQVMVEKLLETATLDSNQLQLNKEKISITKILGELVEKHKTLAVKKEVRFLEPEGNIEICADVFHFENALNNIIDNAVKYGGEKIEVSVQSKMNYVKIVIADNGNALTDTQAGQLFEKFYRVPNGNIHDIKGFGIGLYYSKQVVEKHGGTIEVEINGRTKFTVTLQYEG